MNWEDLKFYKPLAKEELSNAKKSIETVVAEKLMPYGFKKFGRKLIRKSNDLIHIIHLDSRGSWQGSSNTLKTEFAIVSIYDTEILIENFQPISSSYIQNLEPKLKNYYQITKEFNLFAEYISKKIIEIILPYLDKYSNSKDILNKDVPFGKTKNLKQLCELASRKEELIEGQLKIKKDAVFKKLKLIE